MKKILLTLVCLLTVGFAGWADSTTWTCSSLGSSTISDISTQTFSSGEIKFKAAKGSNITTPAYNKSGDVRLYTGNTLDVYSNNPNVIINSLTFKISTQGKKRLTEITASAGTIATQAEGDTEVNWSGSSASLTLTVGEKAIYGSDPNTSAGQLCFDSVDVVYTITSSTRTSVTLSFPQPGYELTLGDSFTAPSVTADPAEAASAVVYTISENGFATIDASTGAVTLLEGKTGNATVTASIPSDNETYYTTPATYTLKVNKPALVVDPNWVADVLEISDNCFNVAKTSTYEDLTYTSTLTGIVYSANLTKNNSNDIQLRSTNNSGIVVTKNAGGYQIKGIEIKWGSSTVAGRTIDVYGKETAYVAASDLYATADGDQGTKLESLVYDNGGELLTSNDLYVGLRSNSSALYAEKITLYWEKVEVPQLPAAPVISSIQANEDDTFSDPDGIQIDIDTAEAGMRVFYTTNGADPNADEDGLFSSPTKELKYYSYNPTHASFYIDGKTTTVKAVALKDGKLSPIATKTFTFVENNAKINGFEIVEGGAGATIEDMEYAYVISGDVDTNPFVVKAIAEEGCEVWYYGDVPGAMGLSAKPALNGQFDGMPIVLAENGLMNLKANGSYTAYVFTKKNGVLSEPLYLVYTTTLVAKASVEAPVISSIQANEDDTFSDPDGIQVDIDTAEAGMRVFYTTNGADPNADEDGIFSSPTKELKYYSYNPKHASFYIDGKTTTVKAVALKDGKLSPIATKTFTFVENNAKILGFMVEVGDDVIEPEYYDGMGYSFVGEVDSDPFEMVANAENDYEVWYYSMEGGFALNASLTGQFDGMPVVFAENDIIPLPANGKTYTTYVFTKKNGVMSEPVMLFSKATVKPQAEAPSFSFGDQEIEHGQVINHKESTITLHFNLNEGHHLFHAHKAKATDNNEETPAQKPARVAPETVEKNGLTFTDVTNQIDADGNLTLNAKDGEYHFFVRNGSVDSDVKMFTLDTTVGINTIDAENADAVIFDLMGRKVKANDALKGIFIVNGKKVVL